MFLIIIDDNKIIKKTFQKNYKYEGIEIDVDNSCISLEEGYIFDDYVNKKDLLIKKYKVIDKNNKEIYLYFYKNDVGLNNYGIYEKTDINMSFNDETNIINKDNYLSDAKLLLINNHLESGFDNTFVNHKKCKETDLYNGDLIELLGFSFYYYDEFLYINSFNVEIKISKKTIEEKVFKNDVIRPKLINYYETEKKELIIDDINRFEPPRKGNSRKLILQVGPTITMSLAMILMAGISIYNSNLINNKLGIIGLLIMPITMLLSGILWPILTSSSESRTYKKEYMRVKKEYIDYLDEYDLNLEKNIKNYLNEEKKYLFDASEIDKKLFYISNKSNEFMKITLGYELKRIDKNIVYTKDNDIDEHLKRIEYRLSHIDNCPLFLDLKNNKRITIINKKTNLLYLLNKYLLELICKYSYDELTIGVYSKNNNDFSNLFSIPHLFINGLRLTLTNERQLQDINNLKLDKPLVLLMLSNTDFVFNNPNIYSILFSFDDASILKESTCIIHYYDDNKGVINKGDIVNFLYYNESIDFNKYYNIISSFNTFNDNNYINSFKYYYDSLNIEDNYTNNVGGLKAEFSVINNELLSFDLHESKDGPHGLIGGSTGSGKSELIISLLLSLTIRYSPEYLNIILIDYKGGGIKESLSFDGQCIPHIIASITNLESGIFERLIVSIDRECKKRQKLFKELSNLMNYPIMNIDEYLDNYKAYNLKPIAHLLIVVDEFAELKKENPIIIKELVSFSRIGRSLGIHLILATQKPSGIIDDEIWSNSHFKIALKVHSTKDSEDIIKNKDAAYLQKPGEFYLQVDNNTIKASSLYSKNDINNDDLYEVGLLDNELKVEKKKIFKRNNSFKEALYYSKKIIETTKSLGINVSKLLFEKPKSLSRDLLINKYGRTSGLVMGEIDDYLNAKNGILSYNLNENLLIYTNRKNEINNILNSLNENKKNTMIVSNKKYRGEYISDSILYEDDNDINYLFKKLVNDSSLNSVLVIEDINTLLSYDEEYLNKIYKLIRRSNVSNYSLILLTSQSNINFKILNSIKNKLAIEIYDKQDLINIFSTKGNYEGKSYYFDDTPITFIPSIIEEYKEKETIVKSYLDSIPNKIPYSHITNNLLIGYDLCERKKIIIKDSDRVLITSLDDSLLVKYHALFIRNTNVKVLLYEDSLITNNYLYIIWLGSGLDKQHIFYVDNNIELDDKEAYMYKNNYGRIIRMVDYE